MSRARILALGAFLLIGGAIALLLRSSPEQPAAATTAAEALLLHGYDAAGRPAWTVEAERGSIADDVGTLADARLVFYREGEETLVARGTTLTYSGSEAVLAGNVEISSGDAYRLTPDELVWSKSSRDLVANRVSIVSDTIDVEAQGFRYTLDDGRWSVSDGFTATLARPSSLRVTGKTAREEDGHLTLSGELALEGEDVAYSCGEISYMPGTEDVRLSEGVEGTFPAGSMSADEVMLTSEGSTAVGRVHLVLERRFFTEPGGSGA